MEKHVLCFVVHEGKLETQALLLAASIRQQNQDKFDLLACVPKDFGGVETGVKATTKQLLMELGVRFVEVENPIGEGYLIGNKLNCLAATSASRRTFLDTDMLCLTPLKLPELSNNQIAVKPADRKTYSWTDEQWTQAYHDYATYQLNRRECLLSTCFDELMWPYFNAGLISIKGCPEFSDTWSNISKALDQDDNYNNKRPWLDQLSLPLVIKRLNLSVVNLTETHNFPANIKTLDKENVELVHYHRPEMFSQNRTLLKHLNLLIENYSWLLNVLKADSDWSDVVDSLVDKSAAMSANVKTYLHTEIPYSGLEIWLKNLKKSDACMVVESPEKLAKPILRRTTPWGVGGYIAQLQMNNQGQYQEINLTLGVPLLMSIQRVQKVLPNVQIKVGFTDPVSTIKAWPEEFVDTSMSTIHAIQKLGCLDTVSSNLIEHIKKIEDKTIIKAMLWCIFANQLLSNSQIKLLHFNQPELSEKATKSANRDEDRDVVRTILNITQQSYQNLWSRYLNQ